MFTVKLANSETFTVTAAEQSSRPVDFTGASRLALRLEAVPADHGLEWYLEKLNASGALDAVQVLCDGSAGLEVQGYTEITEVSLRLLATGEKALTLTLCKPAEAQMAEEVTG